MDVRFTLHIPKSKHVADNTSGCIGEKVTTHSSPDSVVKNFQTSS